MFSRASEDVFHSVPHSPTRLSSVTTEDLERHFDPSPAVHQPNISAASPSKAEEQKTELSLEKVPPQEVREKKKKQSLAARLMSAFK